MSKTELVELIAKEAGLTKADATRALDATLAGITAGLKKEGKVSLVGFGTFETRERAARQGRNPRNPEEVIEIPASKAPVFKAGKGLKDIING